MYASLTILAAFVFIYSVVAGRIEKMVISGPIVFTAFGLVMGPLGMNLLKINVNGEGMRTLAELTLALVLFTDAAGTNMGVLEKSRQIPIRLLLAGLPLTILLGFAVGAAMFPGLTLIEVAILATILAPTDAALGSAVVTNPNVPAKIRAGLNVESGLNDGICVPILFVFLAVATGTSGKGGDLNLAMKLVVQEIGIGLAVGLVLTAVGAKAIQWCTVKKWLAGTWQQIPVVALAFACFSLAQILGGSGFIACFSGGLLFGVMVRKEKKELMTAAQGIGDTLALATWVVFGAVVVGQMMAGFSWKIGVYALLSLTMVRMLPVFLSLGGSGVSTSGKLFMGWFGPRGLASIVFIVIVLNNNLPNDQTLALVVVWTVFLSILVHGFSANPLVTALGKNTNPGEGLGTRESEEA